LFSISDMENQ